MVLQTVGVAGVEGWFDDRLSSLRCARETRAYLVGVLVEKARGAGDLTDSSVVIAYRDARLRGHFEGFQRLGDWILWSGIALPRRYQAHRDVYENIGRLSYYTCHRILQGRWRLYEELADELPRIVDEARRTACIELG